MGTITATPCDLFVVKTMPVSVSSTFAYVTPVITLMFGSAFLAEPVTGTMIIGATVILAGVILVQYMNRQWASAPSSTIPTNRPALQEVSLR
jgi:drug/metabolite transporter (DMT)-like permease